MAETCNFGDHIKKGNFEINNNAWSGGTTQCVYDTPTVGWRWNGSGINYPSIVVGTNFCSWPSTWNKFPVQWKNITSWNVTVEWNYPKQPNGDWNLSFDIYFWDTSNCGNDSHKKMNNMVWIQGGGGLFWQSGSTITVDGQTYYLDDPASVWPRHNFILKNLNKGAGSYTVDLKKLLATQSGLDGNWYIDGIHFGNEYGSDSSGETHITKYVMEMNGETISMYAAPQTSITVTSPNGGESWQAGTAHNVAWTSTGSPGANVKIELLKAGTLVGTVTSSTPNDGLFSWTISSGRAPGTDYKIRVTSTTNSTFTDTSNSNFTILSVVPVKKFDVYSVGNNNNPTGAMAIMNPGGLYTADQACQQVCNILKNIT